MIIAEIGQNHCGSMDLAKRLIVLAKKNGADLVKFQLYDHHILYMGHHEIPDVALTFDQARMLFDYGQQVGIEVFFSVFDIKRVDWCESIGVKRYKIACSECKNIPLIAYLRRTGKTLIISVSPDEKYLPYAISSNAYLLCVPEYPAPTQKYLSYYGAPYAGISDHTIGLDAAKIALARGGVIIEKHFAVDHKTGVDAEWSMTPEELRELKRFERVLNSE